MFMTSTPPYCYLYFMSATLSCLLLAAMWSPAGKELTLGSFVCDVFFCFVTFLNGVLGQVWYLIVLISDFCLRPYFVVMMLTRFIMFK